MSAADALVGSVGVAEDEAVVHGAGLGGLEAGVEGGDADPSVAALQIFGGIEDAAASRLAVLEDERRRLQQERKRVQKELKLEKRKRKRIMEKAKTLTDTELVSVLAARAAAQAKAKAHAKGKGKDMIGS